MHFHRAADDGARVRAFYDDLTGAMADAPYPPGWRKGVYPTQAFLDASIARGELFLAELDGVLTGCMVLNHALGVHPAFARRGTVRMFYDDTGWTDYGLYEYLL